MIDFVEMAVRDQPAPVHGPDSQNVLDHVTMMLGFHLGNNSRHAPTLPEIRDMLTARSRKGSLPPPDGYGMALCAPDGRDHRVDLLQEALDVLMYANAVAMVRGKRDQNPKWRTIRVDAMVMVLAIMEAIQDDEKESGGGDH